MIYDLYDMLVCIYLYTHIDIYIYIYMYNMPRLPVQRPPAVLAEGPGRRPAASRLFAALRAAALRVAALRLQPLPGKAKALRNPYLLASEGVFM